MARDVRFFSKIVRRDLFRNGVSVLFLEDNHIVIDQARADSIKTVRTSNGSYYMPTAYSGRFFLGSSSSFQYVEDIRNPVPQTWIGESAEGQLTNTDFNVYGCTASGSPDISGAVISAAESSVRSKLMSSDMNIGQTIGELPETARFIVDGLKTIRAMLKALRHPDPYSVANVFKGSRRVAMHAMRKRGYPRSNTAKGAASLWLAYQYAWLPILADVYSAVKIAKEGLSQPSPFSARSTRADPLAAPPFKAGVLAISQSWTCKREVTVEINYKISNQFLQSLDSLGLLDPLALAWELLPLSFVVDWFLPIGNFLDALSTPYGVVFESGYRTEYIKWSYSASGVFSNNTNLVPRGKFPHYGAQLMSFRRSPYLGFPIPVPYFRGIGNLGISQMISGLALAATYR